MQLLMARWVPPTGKKTWFHLTQAKGINTISFLRRQRQSSTLDIIKWGTRPTPLEWIVKTTGDLISKPLPSGSLTTTSSLMIKRETLLKTSRSIKIQQAFNLVHKEISRRGMKVATVS